MGDCIDGDTVPRNIEKLVSDINSSGALFSLSHNSSSVITGTSVRVKRGMSREHAVIYLEEHKETEPLSPFLLSNDFINSYYQRCRDLLEKNGYEILQNNALILTEKERYNIIDTDFPEELVKYTCGCMLVGRRITCISQNEQTSLSYLIHLMNSPLVPTFVKKTITVLSTNLGFGLADLIFTSADDVPWQINLDTQSINDCAYRDYYLKYYEEFKNLDNVRLKETIKAELLRTSVQSIAESERDTYLHFLQSEGIASFSDNENQYTSGSPETKKKYLPSILFGTKVQPYCGAEIFTVKLGNKILTSNQYLYNPETKLLKITDRLFLGDERKEMTKFVETLPCERETIRTKTSIPETKNLTSVINQSIPSRQTKWISPSDGRVPFSENQALVLVGDVTSRILSILSKAPKFLQNHGHYPHHLYLFCYPRPLGLSEVVVNSLNLPGIEIRNSPKLADYGCCLHADDIRIVGKSQDIANESSLLNKCLSEARKTGQFKNIIQYQITEQLDFRDGKNTLDVEMSIACTMDYVIDLLLSEEMGERHVSNTSVLEKQKKHSLSPSNNIFDSCKQRLDDLNKLKSLFSSYEMSRDFGGNYYEYRENILQILRNLRKEGIIGSEQYFEERLLSADQKVPYALPAAISDWLCSWNDNHLDDLKKTITALIEILGIYYRKLQNADPQLQPILKRHLRGDRLSEYEMHLINSAGTGLDKLNNDSFTDRLNCNREQRDLKYMEMY